MRVLPLAGQALIELEPPENKDGSIYLPDMAHDAASSPEDAYRRKSAVRGKIVEMGKWKVSKNGFGILPPVGKGATVLISPYVGTSLSWDVSGRLKLIKTSEILAVISENNEAKP